MSGKRLRRGPEEARNLILDAVERLMQRSGYSAVNTRTAALEAGVKPPLVHYHFDTTENLLLESYRRSAARSEAMLRAALQSPTPLRTLWQYNSDPQRTALAVQFLALAAEREVIREEMRRNVEHARSLQIAAIEAAMSSTEVRWPIDPPALAALLAAAGRMIVMETSIGACLAHDDLRTYVESLLHRLEPSDPY